MCFACTLHLFVQEQIFLQKPLNLFFIWPSRPVIGDFDLENAYTENMEMTNK